MRKTARTGALWIAVFWLGLLAVTYGGFKYVENMVYVMMDPKMQKSKFNSFLLSYFGEFLT